MLDDENNLRDKKQSSLLKLELCTIGNLWHEDQSHGQIAAEDVCERDECEGCVLLVRDDEGDGGGDDAEDRHVVDGHPHQPAVVNLLHLTHGQLNRSRKYKHNYISTRHNKTNRYIFF